MLDKNGIAVPIKCGIRTITKDGHLGRSVTLSGTSVPKKLSDIIALHGDDNEEIFEYGKNTPPTRYVILSRTAYSEYIFML